LDRLARDDRQALESTGRRRPMAAGEVLFREGDDAYEVLIVLAGMVKIQVDSPSGRVVILTVLDAGELVGKLSAIDSGPRSATACALANGALLVIPSTRFRDILEEHPSIGLELLKVTAARLRGASRRQLEFSANDGLGRLCSALVELADRYGLAEDGAVRLVLPMGQGELAAWGGLSREAIVKGLKALRTLGWLDGEGRRLRLIDMDSLRARSEG